jgi:hypothetical protein
MAIIQPEVIITPDRPTVRIRDAWEKTDLKKLLPQILQAQGWGVGTYFHVQFLNHDRNQLLADAEFVVTSDMQTLKTTDSAYNPNTKMVVAYEASRVSEWKVYNGYEVPRGTSSDSKEKKTTSDEKKATIRWNPGKKEYQVLVGDEVKFSSPDKSVAQLELDKLAVAA